MTTIINMLKQENLPYMVIWRPKHFCVCVGGLESARNTRAASFGKKPAENLLVVRTVRALTLYCGVGLHTRDLYFLSLLF